LKTRERTRDLLLVQNPCPSPWQAPLSSSIDGRMFSYSPKLCNHYFAKSSGNLIFLFFLCCKFQQAPNTLKWLNWSSKSHLKIFANFVIGYFHASNPFTKCSIDRQGLLSYVLATWHLLYKYTLSRDLLRLVVTNMVMFHPKYFIQSSWIFFI